MLFHHVLIYLALCHIQCSYEEDITFFDKKLDKNEVLTQKWFIWGQLYSYCTHLQIENGQQPIVYKKEEETFDEVGNYDVLELTVKEEQTIAECMRVVNLDFSFNLTKCLLNCNNSVSCFYGCRFYSHITVNTIENFEINKQNTPDLNTSLEVIYLKNECSNLSFWWPNVYPNNTFIKSIYLVTFVTLDGDNQTESILNLDRNNSFIINEKIFCENLGNKSYDIRLEFQLNVYAINYNGYSETMKMSSSIARCGYVSSFQKIDCLQTDPPTITNKRVKLAVIFPTDCIIQDNTIILYPGLLLGILNVLMKGYTVSFKVKPTQFMQGFKNVFHITSNKDIGTYGDRNPGIWFKDDGSGKLIIFLAVNGNASYNIETPPLLLDQWSTITISQSLLDSNFWLSVDLNGENIHRIKNYDAKDFKHVKVYASNPWHDAQNGSISDILIINGKAEYIVGNVPIPIPVKNRKLIAVIPKLDKEYIISLDIFLNKYLNSFTNRVELIIMSTYAFDLSVSLNQNSLCFFMAFLDPVLPYVVLNNNCLIQNQFELNVWFNVEISNILKNMIYVYRIKINGEIFFSKVKQSYCFTEIKVSSSYQISNDADCSIKNLLIVNGFSDETKLPIAAFSVYYADYVYYTNKFPIIKGKLLATLKTLMKVYTVFLRIELLEYAKGNVFHITSSEDAGSNDNRYLAISFKDDGSGKLIISLAVNGNASYNIETPSLISHRWSTTIKISQSLEDEILWLSVDFNGENIHRVENYDARDFKHVKVYASNPWNDSHNGLIDDVLVINGNAEYIVGNIPTAIEKAKKIAVIQKLEKEYFISFDIMFNKLTSKKESVISFFAGTSHFLHIFFIESQIIYEFLGNKSYVYSEKNTNKWYTVVITQLFESTHYINTIKIDDDILCYKTNKKMDSYENTILYISHPDFNNVDASIKNVFIINGITNSSQQNIFVLPTDIANKDADYINYKHEFNLFQNTFLGTLRVMEMEFIVFFYVKPTKYTKGLKSVLHLFLDEDLGASSNRNLSVLFHKDGSGNLSIFFGLNDNANHYIETPALILFKWSSVKISQIYLENKFWLLVDLNGENIYKAENFDARVFYNIKVYASDPWNTAQQGSINDLLIINGKFAGNPVGIIPTQIKRGRIIAEKLTLEKEHFISFDLKSKQYIYVYKEIVNVITFYCQTNNSFVIYDFFFQDPYFKKLRIRSIYGPDTLDNLSPFELNLWSNVEVTRFLKGNSYTFTIRINGELYITESVNNVSSYDNVSVFASRDGFYAHDGLIKNMLIINGISNTSAYQRKSKSTTSTKAQQKDNSTIIIGITTPLSIVFIIITAVLVKMYRKNKIQKSLWKINYMDSNLKDFNDWSKDEWEIFPGSITLEKKIGEGAFGNVFIGKICLNSLSKTNQKQKSLSFLHINNELINNVAVKLLKDGANQSEFDDFCEEINLMKEIRYHKNIVNMIGCSTIKKPLCLIVEFMENGDLLNYLRKRRTKLFASKVAESAKTFMYTERYQQSLETIKSENSSTEYVNDISFNEVEQILPDDLLSFAWQVASGMEFLSYNKLVHRDLAARNILVGGEKNVKISDFGLTRKINDELNYMGNKNRRLPVKWMSVEAIFDQIFTSCSDVWAYGVVLFEIVTLGGTPYPSISNRELLTLLKTGYRMDRPENCSEIMYDMMMHCWNENPLKRPTFTELREHLDKIISQGDSYFSFDVNEQSNYYKAASFNSLPSETTDDVLDKEILEKPVHVKSFEEIKNRYNDPAVVVKEICQNRETFNPQMKLPLPVDLTINTFNESLSEI